MFIRRLIRLLIAVILVGLVVFVLFVSLASFHRSRAQALMRDIARLQLGTSTFAAAQLLAKNYGGEPWNGPSRAATCSSEECSFRFVFDNRPLNRIPGPHSAELVVALRVEGGYVVSREIDYSVRKGSHYDFLYLLSDGFESTTSQDYEVKRLRVDQEGTPHVLEVNLGSRAASVERNRAYSIDLSCLGKLRGCGIVTAVFPSGL